MTALQKEPSGTNNPKELQSQRVAVVKSTLSTITFHDGKPTTFHKIYDMEPVNRIKLIRQGVSGESVTSLANSMRWTKERVGKTLGLSITTLDRKARLNTRLSSEQSEKLVGMARLIGQVEAMVKDSGEPKGFNAAQWFASWLDQPAPALGGEKPIGYMDTAEGRELLSRLIATAQSGAYV